MNPGGDLKVSMCISQGATQFGDTLKGQMSSLDRFTITAQIYRARLIEPTSIDRSLRVWLMTISAVERESGLRTYILAAS